MSSNVHHGWESAAAARWDVFHHITYSVSHHNVSVGWDSPRCRCRCTLHIYKLHSIYNIVTLWWDTLYVIHIVDLIIMYVYMTHSVCHQMSILCDLSRLQRHLHLGESHTYFLYIHINIYIDMYIHKECSILGQRAIYMCKRVLNNRFAFVGNQAPAYIYTLWWDTLYVTLWWDTLYVLHIVYLIIMSLYYI